MNAIRPSCRPLTPGDLASGTPSPQVPSPGPWGEVLPGSAAAGLDGSRLALERLQHRLEEATRPTRFKPIEDLSLARILIGDPRAARPVVGEILDLSPDGMKIALAVSQPVEVDQLCNLLVGAPEGECYELVGTVRWVDRNPYITVFGLALEDAILHNPSS